MRKVCISTGCLWGPYGVMGINKEIKLCSKLDIDGIEILFGEGTRLFQERLNRDSVKILKDFELNTVHVPFRFNKEKLFFPNNNKTKKIFNKIYEIYDQSNAVNINIHPQQIKSFGVLNKDYNYSIENMEKHHEYGMNYYAGIFKKNPEFKLVLDSTHAVEAGELKKLIRNFKKKIVHVHLSANYSHHLHLPLHILKDEYLKEFKILKSLKIPFVLENSSGKRELKEYQKEVNFVRKWLN